MLEWCKIKREKNVDGKRMMMMMMMMNDDNLCEMK